MTQEPPKSLSMRFWEASQAWIEHESAARIMEELKTSMLSQKMLALGDMPVSRAEMVVKASEEYQEYIKQMVEHRKAANIAKAKLEYLRMRHSEDMSREATNRLEARL